jgi:hypothetical protein
MLGRHNAVNISMCRFEEKQLSLSWNLFYIGEDIACNLLLNSFL